MSFNNVSGTQRICTVEELPWWQCGGQTEEDRDESRDAKYYNISVKKI